MKELKHIKLFEAFKHGTLHTEKFSEEKHIPIYQKLADEFGYEKTDVSDDFFHDEQPEEVYGYWEKTPTDYFVVYKPEFDDVQISYVKDNKSGHMDAVEFLYGKDSFGDIHKDGFFKK